jgi:hypothetical protein
VHRWTGAGDLRRRVVTAANVGAAREKPKGELGTAAIPQAEVCNIDERPSLRSTQRADPAKAERCGRPERMCEARHGALLPRHDDKLAGKHGPER